MAGRKRHNVALAVGAMIVSMLLCLSSSLAAAAATPTNLILILADDVGAETVGAYGGESYRTPHLDQLANDGVRFDQGHAQPLCTPSRVKIMTGQYNFRNYTHFGFLDPGETTFGHVMRDAGYRTTIAGKWQLYSNVMEDLQGALPEDAGFDEYLLWQLKPEQRGPRYWAPLLNNNGELRQHPAGVYGPDVFNDYLLDYIEMHRDEPFFIYYPMVLAHDPWVTTPDMRDEAASDQDKFAAMVAYMDKMVGNVRAKVDEQGIADRTLILFIGDNGTGRDIVSRQHGQDVQGAKGKTITHGTRVPFMAWGPGIVAGGRVSGSLVNLNDILPTLAELTNTDLPEDDPGDGQSLVPVLTGAGEPQRESVFIHYDPRWNGTPARYAFDHRYKLYEGGRFYDMEADILEQSPLATNSLEAGAAESYQRLRNHIESMPGEISSTWSWLPLSFKLIVGGGIGLLLAACALIWRRLRRRKPSGEFS
jgi:arylsulfatase A